MSKLFRISAPVAFLLALAPAVASAQEWKDFTSAECRCSAQFPGTPQQRTQPAQSKFGSLEGKIITLDVPGNAWFAVYFTDYPKDAAEKRKPDVILNDARDEAVKNVKGKLATETKITMNGFPGRELRIDAPGDMTLHARMYVVNERLYHLLVVTSKAKDASADAKKFLESFKFQKP